VALCQAIVLFAVTNIDDIVVLSLFFSRGNRAPGSTRRIVTGQYLGFGAILAVSPAYFDRECVAVVDRATE